MIKKRNAKKSVPKNFNLACALYLKGESSSEGTVMERSVLLLAFTASSSFPLDNNHEGDSGVTKIRMKKQRNEGMVF